VLTRRIVRGVGAKAAAKKWSGTPTGKRTSIEINHTALFKKSNPLWTLSKNHRNADLSGRSLDRFHKNWISLHRST